MHKNILYYLKKVLNKENKVNKVKKGLSGNCAGRKICANYRPSPCRTKRADKPLKVLYNMCIVINIKGLCSKSFLKNSQFSNTKLLYIYVRTMQERKVLII